MKLRISPSTVCFAAVLVLLMAGPSISPGQEEQESATTEEAVAQPQPMVITSDSLEVNDQLSLVNFVGTVHATRDDFVIECDKMRVHYERSGGQDGASAEDTAITKIIATGGVKIIRAQGGTATADKAVYLHQDQTMVLTGQPMVTQGKDFVEGERIILHLKDNRSVVESSGDKRVKAVIYSREEKGPQLWSK